jgi:hypothetical protein
MSLPERNNPERKLNLSAEEEKFFKPSWIFENYA